MSGVAPRRGTPAALDYRCSEYTAGEVCKQTGLSYRQVESWSSRGLLHTNRAKPGSGNVRMYADAEVLVAAGAKRLIDAGFQPHAAITLSRRIQSGDEPFDLIEGVVRIVGHWVRPS